MFLGITVITHGVMAAAITVITVAVVEVIVVIVLLLVEVTVPETVMTVTPV